MPISFTAVKRGVPGIRHPGTFTAVKLHRGRATFTTVKLDGVPVIWAPGNFYRGNIGAPLLPVVHATIYVPASRSLRR